MLFLQCKLSEYLKYSKRGGIVDKFLGVGFVNAVGIAIFVVLFIVVFKVVLAKWQVPGVSDIMLAV